MRGFNVFSKNFSENMTDVFLAFLYRSLLCSMFMYGFFCFVDFFGITAYGGGGGSRINSFGDYFYKLFIPSAIIWFIYGLRELALRGRKFKDIIFDDEKHAPINTTVEKMAEPSANQFLHDDDVTYEQYIYNAAKASPHQSPDNTYAKSKSSVNIFEGGRRIRNVIAWGVPPGLFLLSSIVFRNSPGINIDLEDIKQLATSTIIWSIIIHVLAFAIGWIVRGFLGIPSGKDCADDKS